MVHTVSSIIINTDSLNLISLRYREQGSAGRDGVLGRSSDGPRPGTSEDEDVEKLFWDGTGRPRTSPEKNADLRGRGRPRTSKDVLGGPSFLRSWSGPGLVRGRQKIILERDVRGRRDVQSENVILNSNAKTIGYPEG